jgi:hypothetical protein
MCSACPRSLRRWGPRSRSDPPAGSESRASAGRDPRGAVHAQADETCALPRRLARVHPHPHPNGLTHWPLVGAQLELHLDRRRRARARRGEHRKESIPLRVDLLPTVSCDTGPDQPVMVGEDARVALMAGALQQRSRTLDIREQEGERFRARSVGDPAPEGLSSLGALARSRPRNRLLALCPQMLDRRERPRRGRANGQQLPPRPVRK